MSSLADILFVAVVLAVFVVIFWRVLGASGAARRGRRRSDSNAPQDSTGGHDPTPVRGRRGSGRDDADGADGGDGGGGDGGGGGGD